MPFCTGTGATAAVQFAGVLADEEVRTRFKDYGVKISQPMTPAQFSAFVAKSNTDWAAVIKQSGLKKN